MDTLTGENAVGSTPFADTLTGENAVPRYAAARKQNERNNKINPTTKQ